MFAASALVLVATRAIALVAVEAISKLTPAAWIQRPASALFVVVLGMIFLVVAR